MLSPRLPSLLAAMLAVSLGCGSTTASPGGSLKKQSPAPAPVSEVRKKVDKSPGHVLRLWESLVASDEAIRQAMDPTRGVGDIGILEPNMETTEDDARTMFDMMVEDAEEAGEEPGYDSYDEFIIGEGIEVEEDYPTEWAQLACTVEEVRVLVDSLSDEGGYHFECSDDSESCTLHGDHGSPARKVFFRDSRIDYFEVVVTNLNDEGIDEIIQQLAGFHKTLAESSCPETPSTAPIE